MQTVRENWTDEPLDEFGKRIDERFDRVDERFNDVDKQFERVITRFDKIDARPGVNAEDHDLRRHCHVVGIHSRIRCACHPTLDRRCRT
jgi:hypothetical protein